MIYIEEFKDLDSILKAVFSILTDERTDKPQIILYDFSRSKNPYKENCFMPVNILGRSDTVERFIEKYKKYKDTCGGFRVLTQLDVDGKVEALFDYTCPPATEHYVMAICPIQLMGENTWEDSAVPIPLYMQKALRDNGAKIESIENINPIEDCNPYLCDPNH